MRHTSCIRVQGSQSLSNGCEPISKRLAPTDLNRGCDALKEALSRLIDVGRDFIVFFAFNITTAKQRTVLTKNFQFF